MRPTGRSSALMRAHAIGDKGSTAISTLGVVGGAGLGGCVLVVIEICRDGLTHDVRILKR